MVNKKPQGIVLTEKFNDAFISFCRGKYNPFNNHSRKLFIKNALNNSKLNDYDYEENTKMDMAISHI